MVCFCDVVVRQPRDIETLSLRTCILTPFAFTSVLFGYLFVVFLHSALKPVYQILSEVLASLPIIYVLVKPVVY